MIFLESGGFLKCQLPAKSTLTSGWLAASLLRVSVKLQYKRPLTEQHNDKKNDTLLVFLDHSVGLFTDIFD